MALTGIHVARTEDEFFLPDLCQSQSILFLVLITELLILVMSLATSSLVLFDWGQLGLSSLFVQWVVLISAGVLCNLRTWLAGQTLARAVMISFALILLITLVFSIGAQALIRPGEAWDTRVFGEIARNVIVAAIMAGIAFRYFYLQNQLRRQEQAELNSRIQALQSRIRPHFLFNSMNIIASLISIEPDLAEEVVEDLSVLFRASLSDTTDQPVSLAEELNLCRKYVHIESLRLDDRLRVDWKISVDEDSIDIPLLTIQPLLENAIYHGIQPLPEGGLVEVIVSEEDGRLTVEISNPTAHENHSHESGNRMALENIRHRLEAVYGAEAEVVSSQDETTYRTIVRYPID
jgi:two-component system, LytTR family, sensor histidine kinase AlgZ